MTRLYLCRNDEFVLKSAVTFDISPPSLYPSQNYPPSQRLTFEVPVAMELAPDNKTLCFMFPYQDLNLGHTSSLTIYRVANAQCMA